MAQAHHPRVKDAKQHAGGWTVAVACSCGWRTTGEALSPKLARDNARERYAAHTEDGATSPGAFSAPRERRVPMQGEPGSRTRKAGMWVAVLALLIGGAAIIEKLDSGDAKCGFSPDAESGSAQADRDREAAITGDC